jgi:hypothetical protein
MSVPNHISSPSQRRTSLYYVIAFYCEHHRTETQRVSKIIRFLKVKSAGKYSNHFVISVFRRQVDENCALLGYYAARSGNFLAMFRDKLLVPSLWVKILTLKMRPIGCPETSVRDYHYSLRNDPEERGP